jgi:hypothetical protein
VSNKNSQHGGNLLLPPLIPILHPSNKKTAALYFQKPPFTKFSFRHDKTLPFTRLFFISRMAVIDLRFFT